MASTVIESALFAGTFADDRMREIFSDESLLAAMLQVEAAIAQAEAEVGLVPEPAAREIVAKARPENFSLAELRRGMNETAHVIVPLVRALAAACEGDAGGYVHWGATTQDIVDSANALRTREAFAYVRERLERLLGLLGGLAEREADTVVAGRTHGQHAVPVTFGYKVAVWCWEVTRQIERWRQAEPRVLVGNLTGAVGTFDSFAGRGPEVQRRCLELLGLGVPEICWHASRDRPAEVASLITLTAGTLEKLAGEVYRLQCTEYGELEEPFFPGKVGSSTMPHKRNASFCEAAITSARAARAEASMVFEATAQEHERQSQLWKVEWIGLPNAFILLAGALAKVEHVFSGLVVDRRRMERNLDLCHGAMLSEAAMLALGRFVGRERAHHIVYEASMRAFEQGRPLRECLLDAPEVAAHLTAAQLDELFQYGAHVGHAPQLARDAAAAVRTRAGRPA